MGIYFRQIMRAYVIQLICNTSVKADNLNDNYQVCLYMHGYAASNVVAMIFILNAWTSLTDIRVGKISGKLQLYWSYRIVYRLIIMYMYTKDLKGKLHYRVVNLCMCMGMSAFKSLSKCFWMHCNTSSHYFITCRTAWISKHLHLTASSGKICLYSSREHSFIPTINFGLSLYKIETPHPHQCHTCFEESSLLLRKCKGTLRCTLVYIFPCWNIYGKCIYPSNAWIPLIWGVKVLDISYVALVLTRHTYTLP